MTPTVHLVCSATGAGKTTFAFAVADSMFDFMEERFEPPGDNEQPVIVSLQKKGPGVAAGPG